MKRKLFWLLFFVFPTVVFAQQAGSDLSIDTLNEKVESIDFVVKTFGASASFLLVLLTVLGVGSYRNILKEMKIKYGEQLRDVTDTSNELKELVEENKALSAELKNALDFNKAASGSVVLAEAEEAISSNSPDVAKAVSILSSLVLIEDASHDELSKAAIFARQRLGNSSLAKKLMALAISKPNASAISKATYADLCSEDINWKDHEAVLSSIIDENAYNESVIKSVANFYIGRDDWNGLEEQMRKAAERAPWLATPHRNRALAAKKLRKSHSEIVAFYEKSIKAAESEADDTSYGTFAEYLYNNNSPRNPEDIDKALELAKKAVQIDPSDDGNQHLLGAIYESMGEIELAIEHLGLADKLSTSSARKRRVQAAIATISINNKDVLNNANGQVLANEPEPA